jgi:hypothetical protein
MMKLRAMVQREQERRATAESDALLIYESAMQLGSGETWNAVYGSHAYARGKEMYMKANQGMTLFEYASACIPSLEELDKQAEATVFKALRGREMKEGDKVTPAEMAAADIAMAKQLLERWRRAWARQLPDLKFPLVCNQAGRIVDSNCVRD